MTKEQQVLLLQEVHRHVSAYYRDVLESEPPERSILYEPPKYSFFEKLFMKLTGKTIYKRELDFSYKKGFAFYAKEKFNSRLLSSINAYLHEQSNDNKLPAPEPVIESEEAKSGLTESQECIEKSLDFVSNILQRERKRHILTSR